MVASAPVIVRNDGKLHLDTKFVDGMRMHHRQWGGPVHCVLWLGASDIPFGADFDADELGFTLGLLAPGHEIAPPDLRGASVVMAAADLSQVLGLAPVCRSIGARLVYTVEYTLRNRLQILRLEGPKNPLRKAWSALWHVRQERRRRAAFGAADGVQFNGYPARDAYGAMARDGLMYLDGRMRQGMMATPEQMATRAARLATGAPLRIVHSGRLVKMKGALDLLPVAQGLRALGANFQMDIFGAGPLEEEIRHGMQRTGLSDDVRLHAAVDFETELVPYLKTKADIFLSCHRQSDPSCTYLESFGCGLPVIGYDNDMWKTMQRESGAGWVVRLADTQAMAAKLAELSHNPDSVSQQASRALEFAVKHDFETEFVQRMDHAAKFDHGVT
jgi:colanic acid/amylovoran biosynthesis glycosyltransferase